MRRIKDVHTMRRRGIALPSVLLIAFLGAAVVGAIFMIATRFGREDIRFRDTYGDQVLAAGYVERAKGRLNDRIVSTKTAIHPQDNVTWDTRPAIASLDDLQVYLSGNPSGDALNVDEVVNGRRVVMKVYDLTYSAANVLASMSEQDRAQLPAPFELASLVASGGNSLATIGAYLIRVQIYDPGGKLARTTEEAFFVVVGDPATFGGNSGTD